MSSKAASAATTAPILTWMNPRALQGLGSSGRSFGGSLRFLERFVETPGF